MKRTWRTRGLSLLEVMISCLLVSIAMLVVFSLFRAGSYGYRRVTSRQGLEAESRRLLAPLEFDLRRGAMETARNFETTYLATGPEAVRRDGLVLATLANWTAPASYDSTDGHPFWDRYLAYYATHSNPGKLVRQIYRPNGAPYPGPMIGFTILENMKDDPTLNTGVVESRVLGQNIHEFKVQADSGVYAYRITLLLATEDYKHKLEVRTTVPLQNSRKD